MRRGQNTPKQPTFQAGRVIRGSGRQKPPKVLRGPRGPYRKLGKRGGKAPKHLSPPAYTSVAQAPTTLVQRAREKKQWIQSFVDAGCPPLQLMAFAADAAAGMTGPVTIPAYTTLRTWVERYLAFGGLRGLIDKPGGRRPRRTQNPGLTEKQDAHLRLIAHANISAAQAARMLAPLGTKPVSTIYHTVSRTLHDVRAGAPHAFEIARSGGAGHRARNELSLPKPTVLPGERFAIDSTVLDCWIQMPSAEDGRVRAHRPVLTILEDEGSRRLLTFGLFLKQVDSQMMTSLMARVFVPGHNWLGLPTVVRPREINADHGAEHHGDFQRAMTDAGISFVDRLPEAPKGGAKVERLHRTMQMELFTGLVGASASYTPLDELKPYVDAKGRRIRDQRWETFKQEIAPELLFSMAELEEKIRTWAVAYNARPHRGLPQSQLRVLDRSA